MVRVKKPYKLLDHQKETINFLSKGGKLCVLPTGTGKTLTSLYYFYNSRDYGKAIIVSENNLLENVAEDNEKFFGFVGNVKVIKKDTPDKRKRVYREFETDDGIDILVLNYHTLVNDYDIIEKMVNRLSKRDYNVLVVCDEAENFREKTTTFYQAVESLALLDNTEVKGFTASPVKKGLEEVYNILTALEGKEPIPLKKFYRKFCDITVTKTITVYRGKRIGYPVMAESDKGKDVVKVKVPYWWVRNADRFFPFKVEKAGDKTTIHVPIDFEGKIAFSKDTTLYISSRDKVSGYKNIKKFKKLLRGKMFGVSKSSLDGVPEVRVIKTKFRLDKSLEEFKTLAKLYEEEKGSIPYATESIAVIAPQITQYEYYWSDKVIVKTSKLLDKTMKRVLRLLLMGEKVIVFTKYTTVADYFESLLKKNGVKDIYNVRGGLKASELDKVKSRAKEKDPAVFILTEAGLRGLNLQTIRRIVVIDMPKSGGDLIQLSGRTARLGSKYSKVYIYFNIPVKTVLEDLYNLSMGQISMIKEFNPELVEKWLEDKEVKKVAIDETDSSYTRKGLNNRRDYFKI